MRRITTWQTVIVLVLLVGSAAGSFPQTVSAQDQFIPDDLPVITPENAAQVTQVAILASYGTIGDIAWSPDGRTLALASSNGLVFLLDATQLDIRPRILNGHTAAVTGLAFSPDGRLLASAGGGEVRLWEVDSGEAEAVMNIPLLTNLAFSPDGTMLAVGSGALVRLHSVATSEEIALMRAQGGAVTSLAFSPDGGRVVTGGSDGTVHLWDVATRTMLAALEGQAGRVAAVAFSPNGGDIASVGADDIVHLWDWDPVMGMFEFPLRGHTSNIDDVAFSPDSKTLAADHGDEIRLWDVGTGVQRAILEGHTQRVLSVQFSPDGRVLASAGGDANPRGQSRDSTIRLWDVSEAAQLVVLNGHTRTVNSASFNSAGTLIVSASEDGTIRLWGVG